MIQGSHANNIIINTTNEKYEKILSTSIVLQVLFYDRSISSLS